jgi:hypothetical protein
VISNSSETSLAAFNTKENSLTDLKKFFDDFKGEIASNVHVEMVAAQEYISKEVNKSKLELGACFENNMRKMEAKMEKHFQDVDLSIGKWRERKKIGIVRRILNKAIQ